MSDVKRLARWTGWCDPCETERPLILTETGERGIRAWLRGIGPDDRTLTLICGVCGSWQHVPHDEDDDAETMTSPITAVRPLGAHQLVVRAVSFAPYPGEPIPVPRVPIEDEHTTLDLLAQGLDLVAVVD